MLRQFTFTVRTKWSLTGITALANVASLSMADML